MIISVPIFVHTCVCMCACVLVGLYRLFDIIMFLHVVGAPAITVTVTGATDYSNEDADHSAEDDVYNVMSGSTFSITCTLSCPTAGILMWKLNDTIISTSTSTDIPTLQVDYMLNANGEITSSVLTRNMAESSDSAMYQCGTVVQTIQSNDTVDIFIYGKYMHIIIAHPLKYDLKSL